MAHEQKKWLDIKKRIQDDILNQKLLPGDKLPRDSDMAIRYGIARNTVQHAMRELSQLGLVERRRKGGTYVAPFCDTQATVKIPVIQDEITSMGQTYGYECIGVLGVMQVMMG